MLLYLKKNYHFFLRGIEKHMISYVGSVYAMFGSV